MDKKGIIEYLEEQITSLQKNVLFKEIQKRQLDSELLRPGADSGKTNEVLKKIKIELHLEEVGLRKAKELLEEVKSGELVL